MKFCPNCGTQTEPEATHCFNCHFPLPQAKSISKQSTPTPTTFDDYPVGIQEEHNSPAEPKDPFSPLSGLITAIIIITILIALIIFIF